MENTAYRAVAIVGVGAVLPDAPNASAFWENVKKGRYSISDVTPSRWDPALYYDPDPKTPDKTYSKIGGWVRQYIWDPMKWHLAIPPRVVNAMDEQQKWAIACTRQALEDYGYPKRPLNLDRTAVILGNAMAGEQHYFTALRVYFPEYARELAETASFAALPEAMRRDINRELHQRIDQLLPEITEDSMPGELANCIAGRIANLYNFHGPNFTADAACASAMAAMTSAVEGLVENDFDLVVSGGIDHNMGASSFIKFCKIGALSATGTRPYAEGADGFVMGEGAAIFLLKRLADAERDGDKIHAVVRGIGGSSDGKGKGITAPNPIGQKFCLERAWQNAGLSPATATLIEGHGTSTSVGDVVEAQSMVDVLSGFNLPSGSIALGSVKSNIGHLKGAAGAAGLLKTTLALRDKVMPPSLHCEHPNPNIDFAHSPLRVNTELRPWTTVADGVRRAGVSAFGFGGTNFHVVLEEYIPHRLTGNGNRSVTVGNITSAVTRGGIPTAQAGRGMTAKDSLSTSQVESSCKAPLRGALVIGAVSEAALAERLCAVQKEAEAGRAPAPAAPAEPDLRATERLAIDYADATELAEKSSRALKALAGNQTAMWKALRAQGVFRGHGPTAKVAFLYTGQGSQYVNMLQALRAAEPIVATTFAEADRVMTPLLGKPLSQFIFVDHGDDNAVAKAEEDLRQTAITQPAVMATDIALTRLLAAYGIQPDMTMGHSLGEYGALVASGALPFDDALEAVSARGREMTRVSMDDNGRMAAVFAPLDEIEPVLKTVDGYVVIANINSNRQAVIGGASKAVERAMEVFKKAGYTVVGLPVSHAFHTSIVGPASEPLRRMLERLRLESPRVPIVANVSGEFYPTGPDAVPQMLDILARQIASPVQFVKGLHTLFDAGARIFVEVGPKKALQGFADEVLSSHGDVVALFTNHPKVGDVAGFNQALCGLYAAGLGRGRAETASGRGAEASYEASADVVRTPSPPAPLASTVSRSRTPEPRTASPEPRGAGDGAGAKLDDDHYVELGHLMAEVLERGWQVYHGEKPAPTSPPVAISGAALGLPGTEHIFDDANIGRILRGDQFIDVIPTRFRRAILDKHITRLVKSDNGGPTFESITDVADVIKLAARGGAFDLGAEFGVSTERLAALDPVTRLAIGAGIDALRDAGIPLVMRYKTTTKGTQLPDRWGLPDALRDDTGVIFASAFPGYDSFADEMSRYYADHARREQLAGLESLRLRVAETNGHSILGLEIDRRIEQLRLAIEKEPYVFDRRFLFRVLSMGHSQFAEFIGARGPNTQVNAACASTSQGVALAEDWIRAGRCRRVIVLSADDITSDHLIDWFGAGFLATGAAATDAVVEEAAIPFDRRRHGMIIGMGAAALVVESAEAAYERGIRPICEVLSAVTANSAFHGTRLDVEHISKVMEGLIAQAETRRGISRHQIAPQTVFVSHETYTPARGGSAAAEIHALRRVFGEAADQIVIANTKVFTGHAMGTGIEEVVAVKALETGCVPPVANFKEVDPELGRLNLSKGGRYPIEYALRLGAGFGSQISMTLMRRVATKDAVRPGPNALGYAYRIADQAAWSAWLSRISGYSVADLEVVRRTLRVRDQKQPARPVPTGSRGVAETAQESRPVPAPTPKPQAPAPSPAPTIQASTVPASSPVLVAMPGPSPSVSEVVKSSVEVKVAPPTPAPAVAAPPKPATQADPVKERILALVAEKTGYPVDMLDLDLDLEADLGVDTVKQAEVFATVREAYGIARDDQLKLRDFPTLAHVIRFVYDRRSDLVRDSGSGVRDSRKGGGDGAAPFAALEPVTTVPGPESPTPKPEPQVAGDAVKERVLNLVVEKTGYPKDMLDLDLDLEADLGVDTVKQAELFAAIREIYSIPRDENLKLRDFPTLAHVIRFVYGKRPDLAGAVPSSPAINEASVPAPTPVTAPATSEEVRLATPAPAAAPSEIVTGDAVKERILDLVVEKTGYPKDMLDIELELEADLGVDTVKQAELFAAIREIYSIPRDENLKLRDFPTLAHVIRFVYGKRPDLARDSESGDRGLGKDGGDGAAPFAALEPGTALPSPESPTPNPEPQVFGDAVKERVLDLVVEKTGYPKEMLDLDLDLEADLGVDTVKQAEMFAAIREIYNIPRDENRKLRDFPTLAHVIRFVYNMRPDLAGAPPASATTVATGEFTAPAAPTPVEAQAIDDNSIKETVLEIVAEKTGYPKDMLDLDLDLEADLGIDTVKQAEMFASVRAAFNIPRDENLKLRDFPTLADVIKFARDSQSGAARVAATTNVAHKTPPPPAPLPQGGEGRSTSGLRAPLRKEGEGRTVSGGEAATTRVRPVLASLDAANSIPRRVPVPNLRPPLAICKATGVTLGPDSRVVLMPDNGGVGEALTQRLQTLGVEVLRIEGAPDADEQGNCLKNWLLAGPVQGVYWLPALDDEGNFNDLDLATWHEGLRVRVKLLYATLRTLYEQVAAPGTFFVSATRLGGQHGYDEAGAVAPLGGAVVGFTKTYKRERVDALVKAVDFEPDCKPLEVAEILVEETFRDPGAVEIGYKGGERWTVGLQEQPADDGQPGLTLDKDTVFLITGAAGSIVSAITTDLAAASGGTFYLLDLVPEPDPNNRDLERFVSDKENLKRDLFARIQARGERATPVLVEKELAALERAQAAWSAIDAVRASGGAAHYFSVNLADAEAVAKVISQVRERSGRIDVLLHAAGLERSHFLLDKDPREFDLVFDVKCDGWFNLLRAIGDMPLGATVAFSSIAGRFGNGGQTDYSAANDLLCKLTSSFRTTRPATRAIVIDWTAWGGIGMATRGSIPKVMELAGIDMLPPEAGVPLIRRELTAGGRRGEIVIGQRLGVMLNEWDTTGGLEATQVDVGTGLVRTPGHPQEPALNAVKGVPLLHAPGPMIGKIVGMGLHHGLTIETTLDPKIQPFLHDHQIDGTPVLPGVMGIEAFAETASCLLPGWHVEAVEDVNFLAPFKFYRNEPRPVTVQAVFYPEGNAVIADCRLIGRRLLPNQTEPQVTTHFKGRVRLTKQVPEAVSALEPGAPAESIVEAADIYRVYFHGPAYQVLARAWRDGNRVVGQMTSGLPGNHHPSERPTLIAPRLIELCFQTAGVWEMGVQGRMGLPLHVHRVSLLPAAGLDERQLYAVVTPHPDQESFDADVVDTTGNHYLRLSGYRTVALPNGIDAEPLKVLQAAMSLEAVTA